MDYFGLVLSEMRQKRSRRLRTERMRAARAKGTHTAEEWAWLVDACGNRCVRCGRSDVRVEHDHIVPVYLGGSDAIENLQPLCARCNSSKGCETVDHRPGPVRGALCVP